ncbi:MAG: hypothetical protein H6Q94_1047 [Nitrospirae bacterium]|nr:hypothetical protein [Nitrospirota bacterium]
MRKYLYHFVFCPYYLNMRNSYSKAISYFSVDYQLKRAQLFKNIILRASRGTPQSS